MFVKLIRAVKPEDRRIVGKTKVDHLLERSANMIYNLDDGFYMEVVKDVDGSEELYKSYLCKDGWGKSQLHEFPTFAVTLEQFVDWSKDMIDACKEVEEKDREWKNIRREWEGFR